MDESTAAPTSNRIALQKLYGLMTDFLEFHKVSKPHLVFYLRSFITGVDIRKVDFTKL